MASTSPGGIGGGSSSSSSGANNGKYYLTGNNGKSLQHFQPDDLNSAGNLLGPPPAPGCSANNSVLRGVGSVGQQGQQLQQLQQTLTASAGFPAPRDGMSSRDSGYSVSTSDGASTCSSSTTDPAELGEGGTLLVLEPKSLRSFTTNDEYLYAMKEDLADWFSCLYKSDVTADNFFATLETGVILCQHANKVQDFAKQRREQGDCLEMRSYFIRNVPVGNVPCRPNVKPETFQARDNVSNFISWGRQLGIPEVLSFETDDLVLRKNEKSVILCLLEIARVGAKLGMLAPTLVQMEEEIDAELAGEEVKPQVQIKTCDMRSLDEMVRDLIGRCTCPIQFPMVKVGDGKYKIGDSRSLIFVRILRNHVMVRVGGGWDTLENYLNKHDPCQCAYRGHRGANSVAHKVSVSQQRRSSMPGNNAGPNPRQAGTATNATASATTAAAPSAAVTGNASPRRMSSCGTSRNRSTSPRQLPSRSKSPTLVISRQQMPSGPKSEAINIPGSGGDSQSPANQHAVGGVSRSRSQNIGINSNNNGSSAQLSSQPTRCKSPSPGRLRSPSPLTANSASHSSAKPASAGNPTRPPVTRASSSSALLKGKGHGPEVKVGTPRAIKRGAMMSHYHEEDEDEDDYHASIVPSDTAFLHPGDTGYRKYDDDDDEGAYDRVSSDLEDEEDEGYLIPGSVSFDERAETNGHDPNDDSDGRKANMSIDKISTMTLTEFKSLLTSALSVPEDAVGGQANAAGITSTASTPGARDANRQPNWGSVRDKARSVRDSISNSVSTRRPTTNNSSSSGNNSPAIGRRSLPQSPDVELSSDPFSRTNTSHGGVGVRRHSNAGNPSAVPSMVARPKTPSGIGSSPSRPKTPTAIGRPKTPSSGIPMARPKTPTASDQRAGGGGSQREEYKMARPRTPSQMKREAVAKVAGAISNWVESRPEMDSASATRSSTSSSSSFSSNRPKTPTRFVGASSSCVDDNDDEIGNEVAKALANPEVSALSSSVRERSGTPSRIPKPSFTPRPITPKTPANDAAVTLSRSMSASPPVPPQTLSLSQHLTESFSSSPTNSASSSTTTRTKSTVISRVAHSKSNSSSPVMSPSGSFNGGHHHDSWSKAVGKSESSSSSGRARSQTPTLGGTGTPRSYKDIYSARRCNTPGPQSASSSSSSVPRSQPSRCVTPGPRERWALGDGQNNNNRSNHSVVSSSPQYNRNSSPKSSKSQTNRSSNSNVQRSSSINDVHSDQIMLTNEITFSDDEEINEMMRNAALRPAKQKVKPGPRSASVDARKLVRQNASAGQEVLVISRNSEGKTGFQVTRKNNASVVKRPPSRGNSTDRSVQKSSTPAKFRSQTPDPSMFRRKLSSATSGGSFDKTDSAPTTTIKSGDKSFNRTEAWVDSTLSDTKRKLPPRPKRGKTLGSEFPISELEPRPLNEIKAILPEHLKGAHVDTEALEAPPEDAEMFKKMEKLFEKYREMELRASVNEIPGAGVSATTRQETAGSSKGDPSSAKAPSHRSLNASSRSSPSVASMKTSSGSMGSSSGGRSSNPPVPAPRPQAARPGSARTSTSEENRFRRSTSSPGSFQKSASGSPLAMSPAQESNHFPGMNSSSSYSNNSNSNNNASHIHSNGKMGRGATISESNPSAGHTDHVASLKDIDSETAKDPAALISKIKEILRVRPRKDEGTKIRTKIPAPKGLAKSKRSKSVSNLFQGDGMSPELSLAIYQDSHYDEHDGGSRLTKTNSTSNTNVAYSEFVYTEAENGDVLTDLTRRSSIQSDSGESGSRCETPVPKLSTPLTTGRSTFINRKGGGGGEKANGRGLSRDKENTLSSSQTSLSSRSMLSATEDEADFV